MTPREKATLLIRVLNGDKLADVASDAGLSAATLRKWCREASVPDTARFYAIRAEEFVRVWQRAGSTLEVAIAVGCTIETARQRARQYRQRGVPLKSMPRYRLDWDRLARIAEEAGDGEA